MSIDAEIVRVIGGSGVDTVTFSSIKGMTDPATELLVYLRDENVTPATETLQTITTHYALTTLVLGLPTVVDMVTAPVAGEYVVVVRNVNFQQSSSYSGSGAFQAASHEAALDKLTAQIQQVRQDVSLSLKMPQTSSFDSSIPEEEAAKYLKVNGAATALEWATGTAVSGDGDVLAPPSTTTNAIATWDSTSKTLKDSTATIVGNTLTSVGPVIGNSFELGRENYRTITQNSDPILVSHQFIDVDTSGGAYAADLPSVDSTHDGMEITFRKSTSDVNVCTITAANLDTIDDGVATTLLLASYKEEVTLVYSDGSPGNWDVKHRSGNLKWAQKFLLADLSATDADISDLKFIGLTVGRTYEVKYQSSIQLDGTDDRALFEVEHNSVVISELRFDQSIAAAGTNPICNYGGSTVFVATATTLIFKFNEALGTCFLRGDAANVGAETWTMLIERSDLSNSQTTDWD
jgi:hypothetical protein